MFLYFKCTQVMNLSYHACFVTCLSVDACYCSDSNYWLPAICLFPWSIVEPYDEVQPLADLFCVIKTSQFEF